jgi:hypothetical protein
MLPSQKDDEKVKGDSPMKFFRTLLLVHQRLERVSQDMQRARKRWMKNPQDIPCYCDTNIHPRKNDFTAKFQLSQ